RVEATLTMSGAARPGEEAGSFYDAVNGTVGRHRTPNPVECTTKVEGNAIDSANEPAQVFVRLEGNGELLPPRLDTRIADFLGMKRPTLAFEVSYKLVIEPGERKELAFSVAFANSRAVASPPTIISFDRAKQAWDERLAHVEAIQTPDKLFTAALRRSAAYSLSLGYDIAGRDETIFHCDHLEWPLDNARDCYHIANSLLLIEPELVRKHLRFYFLDAIPNAGTGKSYIGKGISCGERESRLLDLAAYPLRELYRYWRATGDDAFVADPGVRQTVEKIVADVATWQSPKTGLFASTERSSDERCVYPYFIPGNMLLIATLERLAEMYEHEDIAKLAKAGREAVYRHAVVEDREFGPMFAFEVGDDGAFLLYDHSDIPNLISATRFGFCAQHDPIYQNTLKFIYSARNQGYRGTMDGKYGELCDGS
ncbi:MAG: glycoside hydrolase family 125 protein, partial [Planctomycetes bacterium]|nr:glycoside hydrolase family 125 protein [Planctomycetota bacterium]